MRIGRPAMTTSSWLDSPGNLELWCETIRRLAVVCRENKFLLRVDNYVIRIGRPILCGVEWRWTPLSLNTALRLADGASPDVVLRLTPRVRAPRQRRAEPQPVRRRGYLEAKRG